MSAKVLLYLNTIRRMRPSMILSRLRPQRKVSMRHIGADYALRICNLCIPELDLEEKYASRFDVDALLRDEFLLINERHHVDLEVWNVSDASHLWNFNLHYFEYCVALAAAWRRSGDAEYLECFKRLVRSWLHACPYADGDAWHPYTISLRLVNLLICIDLFGSALSEDDAFMDALTKSMYVQYRHLLINQETHLRANHYWENLKTLLICAAAFDEQDVYRRVMRDFERQLDEQILPDGVHFERSLMYHKLVLEGMLRVWLAAEQTGYPLPNNFMPKVQAMLNAMASLEKGMGKTPFFNDAADSVAKTCDQLVVACKRLFGMDADDSITAFPDAGYYKLYDGDIAVMFDAGEPGGRYFSGHTQCDELSFELSFRNKPVIVNSGTYEYHGELRSYYRSSYAHNVLRVEGDEQLECWGDHKIARTGRTEYTKRISSNRLVSHFVSYRNNGYKRELDVQNGRVCFIDELRTKRLFPLSVYAHFDPTFSLPHISSGGISFVDETGVRGSISLQSEDAIICEKISAHYSDNMGHQVPNDAVEFTATNGQLSWSITMNQEI